MSVQKFDEIVLVDSNAWGCYFSLFCLLSVEDIIIALPSEFCEFSILRNVLPVDN